MPPSGLNDADDELLHWMAEHSIVVSPKILSYETKLPYETIKNRLPKLRGKGLIKYPDVTPDGVSSRGAYELTELGYRYVTGEATIGELREAAADDE